MSVPEVIDQPEPPKHGTRAQEPGPRGCWALTSSGRSCGAARRNDSDYCNAHAGIGIARDPKLFQPLAVAARKEKLAVQARVRAVLGITRTNSPRSVLKAQVYAERERLAARAVRDGLSDGRLALQLIREVDPPASIELTALPTTPEEASQLGLGALLALAQEHAIPLPAPIEPGEH